MQSDPTAPADYDNKYSYLIQIIYTQCQVFLSNSNNYMVSSNYFYLISLHNNIVSSKIIILSKQL